MDWWYFGARLASDGTMRAKDSFRGVHVVVTL